MFLTHPLLMTPSVISGTVLGGLIGLALGVCGYTFIYARGYSYLSNDPQACANCHAMNDQYSGWLKSSHHSVATCNDCHTPHTLVGKYATKAENGFWHSFYFTTGWYPENIEIREVATNRVALVKSVDMRGNNDESWIRTVRFLVRDIDDRRQANPRYGL